MDTERAEQGRTAEREAAQTLHVFVNPAAGGGQTGRRWPAIARRIRARGFDLRERSTTVAGETTGLVRCALREGAREIVVAGGDGTVNEAVNGFFAGATNQFPDAVLSVVPCGTGGDFCRNLGIATLSQAIGALGGGSVEAIDIGLLRYRSAARGAGNSVVERCFVNSADTGYGARTAAWVNRATKSLGCWIYLVGAARTILAHPASPARIEVDGEEVFAGRIGIAVVANGRYHAGGMLFAPSASLQDGLLDVLIVREVPKWKLLTSLLPRAQRGRHIGHPAVLYLRGRHVRISTCDPVPFEVDGEQPGTTDVEAEVLASALRVRRPALSGNQPRF